MVVELRAVKFCKVEEPLSNRLERFVKPAVAVTVPVKLAAEEIVWPLISPEVTTPRLELVLKRLVDDAVVEKKFVVVAWVPVALTKVKFWRVEDPVIRSCPPIFANRVFESKKNGAVVVAEFPIVIMSELFKE